MRRFASFVTLLALALALAGCAGTGSGEGGPGSVLAETEANLAAIESGNLSLRLLATGTGEESGEVGIELSGPFAFGTEGRLPVAELEYTEIGGEARAGTTFISTGEKAFLELGGATYELPAGMVEGLRGRGADDVGLASLGIEDWLLDPELSQGPGETDRVEGALDVGEAASDLTALLAELGAGEVGPLDENAAETLERAAQSSRIVVVTGSEDRLLRRLTIELELGVEGARELEQALEGLGGGAALTFDLHIEQPNEPVHVDEPADAVPYPG
jgi:hypothetical protein